MSYRIDDTTITLTRGDSFFANVKIYKDDEVYTPVEGDTIRFALKRDVMSTKKDEFIDKSPLIMKNIPIDSLILALNPEDTQDLGFGTYVYDIEITFSTGVVDTFIADAKFILAREVH